MRASHQLCKHKSNIIVVHHIKLEKYKWIQGFVDMTWFNVYFHKDFCMYVSMQWNQLLMLAWWCQILQCILRTFGKVQNKRMKIHSASNLVFSPWEYEVFNCMTSCSVLLTWLSPSQAMNTVSLTTTTTVAVVPSFHEGFLKTAIKRQLGKDKDFT